MILALHGNLGSVSDWESLGIPCLQAIDLWRHSHLTFTDFAEELSKADQRPVLVGYSLGGRLALHAMAAHPGKWGGAIIVSSHPGLPGIEDRMARRTSDAIWAKRVRELPWSEFVELWNAQAVLAGGRVPTGQASLESKREAIALAFENWSLGVQDDLRPRLSSFSSPVLWITGERDPRFSEIGRAMAEIFPDFRHTIVPECGHRVLQEKPEELRGLICSFLKTARSRESAGSRSPRGSD